MREITPRSWPAFTLIFIVVAYAMLLLGFPFVVIIHRTFREGLAPVLETFADPSLHHALGVTFVIGSIAVTINAVFGLITAWVLVRHRFVGRGFFDALVDIPFVFATPIAGYSLILLFGRGGWFDSPFPIVFAYPAILLVEIFVALPFVTRELQPVLGALNPEYEEAAYTAGASRWMTFRRILLPEIWTALLYGVVLTFARTIGEFGAVSVVSGSMEGYTETATIFVFRTLNDRNQIAAYSVSVLLCIISVVILIVMNALKTRFSTNAQQAKVA